MEWRSQKCRNGNKKNLQECKRGQRVDHKGERIIENERENKKHIRNEGIGKGSCLFCKEGDDWKMSCVK